MTSDPARNIDDQINQRIFETSLDLILVVDGHGRLLRVSPSSNSILGYDPAEMTGRIARDFLYPPDLDNTRSEMRQARYGGVRRDFECRYVHKAGRVVTLWWAGVWSEPERQYFFIGRDVTERVKTAQQLRDGEARLALALETAELGIAGAASASEPAETDAQFNRIYGLPPNQGRIGVGDWLRLIHPDDRDAVAADILRALKEERPYSGEFRIRRAADGQERWVRAATASARGAAGGIGQFIGIHRDVTEQRQGEDRMRQAQKMEAIGNLTGGMAHDFNNVLGVVMGNLDLAKTLVDETSELHELLDDALGAAASGAELTRRLLAFARRQPLRPERIDANALISELVRLLRRTLGENIEITLDLAADLWPVVVDPSQLEAAITNLATNARDAMENGGRLTIATVNRQFDADYAAAHVEVAPGDYAAIEVTDTGAGMPPEIAERIFEPFYTTKAAGRGTGLGLSMVFGFMKQSGGHISVYSEPGIGTTLRLYLPRALTGEEQTARRAPAEEAERGIGETVLAVEDNPNLRRVVLRQLRQLGYNAIDADGPAAALDLLAREKVDVLFTDVMMPGPIDGIGLAREAVARWPGLKIVLTSGFPGAKLDQQLGTLGVATRLLSKPYRVAELGRALHETLRG